MYMYKKNTTMKLTIALNLIIKLAAMFLLFDKTSKKLPHLIAYWSVYV